MDRVSLEDIYNNPKKAWDALYKELSATISDMKYMVVGNDMIIPNDVKKQIINATKEYNYLLDYSERKKNG